jgi:hypothetical protein
MRLLVKFCLFGLCIFFVLSISIVVVSYFDSAVVEPFLIQKIAFAQDTLFQIGFYIHIISATVLVLLCSILVFFSMEKKYPKFHRLLGKLSLLIAIAALPSALILSYFAEGGVAGKFLFFLLSMYTCFAFSRAYKCVIKLHFCLHQYWMEHAFLLLCSAFILRFLLVLCAFTSLSGPWVYPIMVAISWLPGSILHYFLKFPHTAKPAI